MKPFSFIMQYIKRYKFRYLAGIFTLFAVDAANVFIPRLTGAITDGLTARTIGWSSVRNYLFAIMLLGLTLAIGRFLWRYFLFGTARVIERELRNDMFAHLETMDVEYYNAHKTGDLMTRFTSDLNAVRMALGPAVICIFDSVVMTILVVFQMMRYVNVKLTLLALIPMVIICLGYMHYGRVLDNLYTERQDSVSNLADFVQESFSGIRVIKAFVRKQSEILSFGRKNQDTMDKSMKIAGRINGSVYAYAGKNSSYSLYYYRNIDKTMRDSDEILNMWEEAGLDTNNRLAFMCGSGWRAAEVLWDAKVMGLDNTTLYSDGWIGWSNLGYDYVVGEP